MECNCDRAHRYTLELSHEQDEELSLIKRVLKGASRADAIRRALGLAALVADTILEGKKLAIVDQDGKVLEVIKFV